MKELEYIRRMLDKKMKNRMEYLRELSEMSLVSIRSIYKLMDDDYQPSMKTVMSVHDALKTMKARSK